MQTFAPRLVTTRQRYSLLFDRKNHSTFRNHCSTIIIDWSTSTTRKTKKTRENGVNITGIRLLRRAWILSTLSSIMTAVCVLVEEVSLGDQNILMMNLAPSWRSQLSRSSSVQRTSTTGSRTGSEWEDLYKENRCSLQSTDIIVIRRNRNSWQFLKKIYTLQRDVKTWWWIILNCRRRTRNWSWIWQDYKHLRRVGAGSIINCYVERMWN